MGIEWLKKNLDELCSPRREFVKPSSNGINKYVGLEHIDPGVPRIRRWGTDKDLRSSKSRFYKKDVLYGKLRPYLDKAALAEWDGVCSTDILPLQPIQENVDSEYLSFLLHTPEFLAHAVATTSGVNHPRTSWTSLANFSYPVPSLPEQRVIAGVLSKIQAAMEVQDKIVTTLKELKAATMEKLFREGLRGEPLKKTEIGGVPESWGIKRFGDFATLQRGYDLPAHQRNPGTIPVIGSNGIVGYHNMAMAKGPGVCTGRSGTMGLSFYSENDYWPLNTALFVVDFHGNYPLFVHHLFECFDFQRYAAGVSVPTLNRNLVHKALVAVPDHREQIQIATILKKIDTAIRIKEERCKTVKFLFSSILHLLMTGQVRISFEILPKEVQ